MSKNKKEAIMETAKRLFAEKGYDATGIDEIATMAGVPKSLIYYHFKNKEDLLNTIIAGFFDKYAKLLNDETDRGIDKISRYIKFLKENKNSTRILVMESLKQTGDYNAIFKGLEILKNNDPDFGAHLHLVTEFFTSIIPNLLFVCYEENWCKYFTVKPKKLENDFIKAYKLTHGAYHEFIEKESL